MAQLTLYVDEKIMGLFKQAAKHEKESISSWAKKRLMASLRNHWPKGFFELAGALKDEDNFQSPEDVTWDKAGHRKIL